MNYKVVIPTCGIGSRLGDFTTWTNKSLVPIAGKPAICRIIDGYFDRSIFVVLLGHHGDHVKQLLKLLYPKHNFIFVDVDKYEGQGSSLVYSILQAEPIIDCPFILHACDALVPDTTIPEPQCNWLGGYRGHASAQYTTFDILNGHVTKIHEKGQKDYDYVFIGVAGIYDWKDFFSTARAMYDKSKNDAQLSNIHIHKVQLIKTTPFEYREIVNWMDVGNVDSLIYAEKYYDEPKIKSLPKRGESLYVIDDKVVKFFANKDISQKRVKRAEVLHGLVPRITASSDNFYAYNYVHGDSLASIACPVLIRKLLWWAKDKLWHPVETPITKSWHKTFYYDRTLSRLIQFTEQFGVQDEPGMINGAEVPSAESMLASIPKEWFSIGTPSIFHGDFILDNIIHIVHDIFLLTDWRQDFNGNIEAGDVYYDLAKLNCSLFFNQDIVRRRLYSVSENDDDVRVDILVSSNLLDCKREFDCFVKANNYDAKFIEILTAIVWLNMAPLHEYPLSVFLYYYGRLKLHLALETS